MDTDLRDLKTKIKQWESQFHVKNCRKPSRDDIKGSEVEGVYVEYWNEKRKNENVLKQDVWGVKFNKAKTTPDNKLKKSCTTLKKLTPKNAFSDKLWKHCTEFNKQSTKISIQKAPAYSPAYNSNQTKQKTEISPFQHVNERKDEMKQNVPTPDIVHTTPKDNSENYDEGWGISSSKLKFCAKRQASLIATPSKLRNSEITLVWLDKCVLKSEEDIKADELDQECPNTKVYEPEGNNKCDTKSYISDCEILAGSRENAETISEEMNSDPSKNLKGSFDSSMCISELHRNNHLDATKCESNLSKNYDIPKTTSCANSSFEETLQGNDPAFVMDKENPSERIPECEQLIKKPSKKRKAIVKNATVDSDGSDSEMSQPPTKKKKSTTSGGNGLVSDNFVRINIQRKRFTRGPKKLNVRHQKFMDWKKKKWSGNKGKCFGCGQAGHWAQNCPKKDEAVLNEEAKIDSMGKTNEAGVEKDSGESTRPVLIREPIPEFDESHVKERLAHFLRKFKHQSFRPFQEEAMQRILSGQSTLLVLPTGSGKSLCYQIPACIYAEKSRCITLVISPLVSLMDDQVKNLPSFLRMVCLHSGLNAAQRQHSLESLKSGEAHVLLMAPESLIAMHSFMRTSLPPVAFACIDEAHCLSEWSHNFRPSYLQVLKVLRGSLDVRCILGLSATVTRGTIDRISALLAVNPEDAVFGEASIPSNLQLSVSRERDKDKALLELLSGDQFQELHSIIIYCTRRETTERLATNIRIHFQNSKTPTGTKVLIPANQVSAYHAGMTPAQRKSAQKSFMKGKLRIIVATVAFGMGLNKADVRSVIHFDLPKTFESYVQEIGRAGRDGLPAYCHLFLQPQAKDLDELKRHIYSNGIDRHTVRKVLDRIFKPRETFSVDEFSTEKNNDVTEVAISIDDIVQSLDVKKENIETLLCYLELHPEKWFEILPTINNSCTIQCYGGSQQMENLALKCKPISVALTLNSTVKDTSKVKFSLVDVCSIMNWDSELVRKDLRNLQFASVNGVWRRTSVLVEFAEPSFHLRLNKPVTPEQRDKLLNFIHQMATQLQQKDLRKLNNLFLTFKKFSRTSCCLSPNEEDLEASEGLKSVLHDYFRDKHVNSQEAVPKLEFSEEDLCREIRSFLDIHHENRFNARQIAQVFYGIGSPQYPAEVWGKVRRFWRSHLHIDFPDILSAASKELVHFRS